MIWHQGCPGSKLHFLNFFPFLIPIWLHAPYMGELDFQSHRFLDWHLQRLGSCRQGLCYQTACLERSWSFHSSMWHNNSIGIRRSGAQHCNKAVHNECWNVYQLVVELLKLCLAFEISEVMLNQIDEGFQLWVNEKWVLLHVPLSCMTLKNQYRLYYENDPARLSACPLTIHSLLHIAWGIKVAGPVWTYWAFAMECHCNTLL